MREHIHSTHISLDCPATLEYKVSYFGISSSFIGFELPDGYHRSDSLWLLLKARSCMARMYTNPHSMSSWRLLDGERLCHSKELKKLYSIWSIGRHWSYVEGCYEYPSRNITPWEFINNPLLENAPTRLSKDCETVAEMLYHDETKWHRADENMDWVYLRTHRLSDEDFNIHQAE